MNPQTRYRDPYVGPSTRELTIAEKERLLATSTQFSNRAFAIAVGVIVAVMTLTILLLR